MSRFIRKSYLTKHLQLYHDHTKPEAKAKAEHAQRDGETDVPNYQPDVQEISDDYNVLDLYDIFDVYVAVEELLDGCDELNGEHVEESNGTDDDDTISLKTVSEVAGTKRMLMVVTGVCLVAVISAC